MEGDEEGQGKTSQEKDRDRREDKEENGKKKEGDKKTEKKRRKGNKDRSRKTSVDVFAVECLCRTCLYCADV